MKFIKIILGIFIALSGSILMIVSIASFEVFGVIMITVSGVVIGTGLWLVNDALKKK